MGTASDMDVTPAGALAIGFAAGVLSTVGYAYIKVSVKPYYSNFDIDFKAYFGVGIEIARHMRRQQPPWYASRHGRRHLHYCYCHEPIALRPRRKGSHVAQPAVLSPVHTWSRDCFGWK